MSAGPVNWGLFLALMGLLLPLAHGLRVFVGLLGGDPTESRAQQARLIVLLLLCIPISGKLPAMLFAITGRYGDVSQLTETFMRTGWGYAHATFTVAAVATIDLFGAGILAALAGGDDAGATDADADPESPASHPLGWHYLRRDLGVAMLLLLLAWVAAR